MLGTLSLDFASAQEEPQRLAFSIQAISVYMAGLFRHVEALLTG